MIHNFQFTNSSMLDNCSYNDEKHEFRVTFNNGKEYTYDNDKIYYDRLIAAKSPGKEFNSFKNELTQK